MQNLNIRAGMLGNWAPYDPGALVELFLQTAVEYASRASFNVNFPESFGSTTFNSTMITQTLQKVTNIHQLRPTSELPFMGKLYRYDNGTVDNPWKEEHWSCEWAPGWTGGDCWNNGS